MSLRAALLTICIAAFTLAAQGQGIVVNFFSVTFPLTDSCIDGDPLPVGTPVLIFGDPTFDGPSDDDYQPVVGNGSGEVNYNSFIINGPTQGLPEGTFISDPNEVWRSFLAPPAPFLFYLVVCGPDMQWYSNTFVVQSGYQEITFNEADWTCLDEACDICLPPTAPTDVTASTNLCTGVELTWTHDGNDICGFKIDRGGSEIAEVDDTVRLYVDGSAPVGISTYRIRAKRCCLEDTLLSVFSEPVDGTRLPGPPVPILDSVTVGLCNEVRVMFHVNTVQGLDGMRIYCDDTLIGDVEPGQAGEDRMFPHTDPTPGDHDYYVVGYSEACGDGNPSDTGVGSAIYAPGEVENLTVSTDDCDGILVAWEYSGTDADEFSIRRNTTQDFAIVAWVEGQTEYSYFDATATPGVTYGFAVVARNECGDGDEVGPIVGSRLDAPGVVADVEASDAEYCDCIEVTWTDFGEEVGVTIYTIFRDNNQIAQVNPGVGSYLDCDASLVPGQDYTYIITGTNACGEGNANGDDIGSVRMPNDGLGSLSLVNHAGSDWDYELQWVEGCVSRLVIRDLCTGTTGSYTGTANWSVTTNGPDSVVWETDTPLDEGTVDGFRLTNDDPGCQGFGRWNAGDSSGFVEGPLPVAGGTEIPTEYALNVYPNPFNPTTNLAYALPKGGEVEIRVYDINGRLTRELVTGFVEAGYHNVSFDATGLPSGIYFARIHSGSFVKTKKLMMLK